MTRVLNIAHRGFTRRFPDNTIEAFEAAIKLGVDGIECDVQETADKGFVIFHDNDIEGRPISGMTVEQVREVRLAGQYRVPTLEETLRVCHRRVKLNLELKLVYGLDRFVEAVKAVMSPEELLVSSFYGTLIQQMAELAPEIPRGILTGFPVQDPLALMELTRAQTMLPGYGFLTAPLVETLHARRLACIVWDCNNPEHIRTALVWGVDGIITDNPDLVAEEMRKKG